MNRSMRQGRVAVFLPDNKIGQRRILIRTFETVFKNIFRARVVAPKQRLRVLADEIGKRRPGLFTAGNIWKMSRLQEL